MRIMIFVDFAVRIVRNPKGSRNRRPKKIMKTTLLVYILCFSISGFAGSNNYVTITVPGLPGTNAIYQISQGQSAEVVGSGGSQNISVQINGQSIGWTTGGSAASGFIAGPATFVLSPYTGSGSSFVPSYLTLNIIPSTFDVQKTLILLPGPGQFYVSLQSSTDLVNWAPATNGIYGSPTSAQFFRISMTSTNSP